MAIENLEKKLNALARPASKEARDAAKQRMENRDWLKKSFEISLRVLSAIKQKGWNQKQLAEAMGVSPQQVSKIMSGKENFTLQTITSLENILETQLVKTSFQRNEKVKTVSIEDDQNQKFQTVKSQIFISDTQQIGSDGDLIKAPKWTVKAENYLRVA